MIVWYRQGILVIIYVCWIVQSQVYNDIVPICAIQNHTAYEVRRIAIITNVGWHHVLLLGGTAEMYN